MSSDVLVTGIGIVSPVGCGAQTTWASLLAGRAPFRALDGITVAGGRPAMAGRVVDGDVLGAPGEPRDRIIRFALAAAREALASAGLAGQAWRSADPSRIRLALGTSKPLIDNIESCNNVITYPSSLPAGSTAVRCPWMPDAPAGYVASALGIRGGTYVPVAACATGTLAVIRAAQWIDDGQADLVLCGSSDASIHPFWLAAFQQMGVLAPEHPTRGPQWACRPFDRDRQGFVLGEGAAILVLESPESLRHRDGRAIARIRGYAMGTDPAGLTKLTPDAKALEHVMAAACGHARCRVDRITCIHAHGTGTVPNDLVESRAITGLLGARTPSVPVISIKGVLGHLLGAAGAVELAVATLACHHRQSPGNATLLEPDPALGPLCLPRQPFDLPPGPILKTSLGFGGHLAALVLERVESGGTG